MIEKLLRRALIVVFLGAVVGVVTWTVYAARMRDEVRATNWIRRQSMPGGWAAYLDFTVAGDFAKEPFELKVDRKRHRCRGLPDGVRVLPSATAVALRGRVPDRKDLGDLQDTVGVVSALLDQGGTSVVDGITDRRWTAAQWRAAFMDREDLERDDHVRVALEGGTIMTAGMRKFGRPDIVLRGIPGGREAAATLLVTRLVDFEVDGGVLDVSREIKLDGYPEGIRMLAPTGPGDMSQASMWIEVTGFR